MPAIIEAAVADLPEAKRKVRSPRRRAFMKLVRRVHLYSGLVLVLPVILYGLTAALFNHPTWMSERTITTSAADSSGDLLRGIDHDATTMAEDIVAFAREEGHELTLVADAVPRFSGSLRASSEDDTNRYSLSRSFRSGDTLLSISPKAPDRTPAPFALSKGPEATPWGEDVEGRAREILTAAGADEPERISLRQPRLEFAVMVEGKRWDATYDLRRRRLSGRPADEPSTLTSRSFLLRLHTAHGFFGRSGPRWIWAVLVDVMAFAMILWGLSGLIMWWQLKKLRAVGAVAIGLGVLCFVALAIAMHGDMT